MNYGEYIRSELLLLIPVLNIVGAVLKKSRLPDRWIPLLLGGLGILLSACLLYTSWPGCWNGGTAAP